MRRLGSTAPRAGGQEVGPPAGVEELPAPRGQVSSRGTTRLVVPFEGEDHTVSIRPHLVRMIPR
jgi:hypothetical protein